MPTNGRNIVCSWVHHCLENDLNEMYISIYAKIHLTKHVLYINRTQFVKSTFLQMLACTQCRVMYFRHVLFHVLFGIS